MLSPYLGEERSEPEGGMESQLREKLCRVQAETTGWEKACSGEWLTQREAQGESSAEGK